jgi:hypothetical protein
VGKPFFGFSTAPSVSTTLFAPEICVRLLTDLDQLAGLCELLAKAEGWARSHRCVEMASDAIIDNELSQRAHEALGYEVVDRCVHYRKRL